MRFDRTIVTIPLRPGKDDDLLAWLERVDADGSTTRSDALRHALRVAIQVASGGGQQVSSDDDDDGDDGDDDGDPDPEQVASSDDNAATLDALRADLDALRRAVAGLPALVQKLSNPPMTAPVPDLAATLDALRADLDARQAETQYLYERVETLTALLERGDMTAEQVAGRVARDGQPPVLQRSDVAETDAAIIATRTAALLENDDDW